MLVLSRKRGETIRIGDDVTVTVLEIRPDVIRLGIEAPREMSIHRQEVYERIHGIESSPVTQEAPIEDNTTNPVV